jgi:hypothetical protein
MRSSDLGPLLAPPAGAGGGVGFRQGVIVTWDPVTANNQVLVGKELFDNLPILNTSEAAILAEGDVVGILTSGPTWGILGRFTIPGSVQAVSALSSLRTQSADVSDVESTTSDTFTDLSTPGPTVDISVGASGRLLIILGADMEFEVPSGSSISTSGGYMAFQLSGANTLGPSDGSSVHGNVRYSSAQAGGFDTSILSRLGASRVVLRSGLAPGLTTVTAKYRRRTNGAATFSNRNLTAMAL